MLSDHVSTHPRVFVFNSSLRCTNQRRGKDLHQILTRHLVPTAMLVNRPSDADMLFHPACLVDEFFLGRQSSQDKAWRNRVQHLERDVLGELSATGSDKPAIINALRCTKWDITGAEDAYPLLWRFPPLSRTPSGALTRMSASRWRRAGRSRRALRQRQRASTNLSTARHWWFARTCSEAMALERAQPEQPCSIYMPYFTNAAASASTYRRPPSQRRLDVLFVGTNALGRRTAHLAALQGMAQTHRVLVLTNISHDAAAADSLVGMHADASFTLCPQGDTPESQRIYQALQHGSIPLVNERFRGPRFIDWGAVSHPLRLVDGAIELPSPRRAAELHHNIVRLVDGGALRWEHSRELRRYVGAQLSRVAHECFGWDGS